MEFGDKLKQLRKENKITQEEMSTALDISRKAYIAYEKNNVKPKNPETYVKIAEKLGCDVNELIDPKMPIAAGGAAAALAFFAPLAAVGVATGTYLLLKKSDEKKTDENTKEKKKLLEYKTKQKQFAMSSKGILISNLGEVGIEFSSGGWKKELSDVEPDDCFAVTNQVFNTWWINYWSKNNGIDSRFNLSNKDRAVSLLSYYVATKPDSKRKISIVVDDVELFDNLCDLADKNSFKGNITAILIDIENSLIKEEKLIATYSDNTDGLVLF